MDETITSTLSEADRRFLASLPDGWDAEVDHEGGQPNGLGEIEPSDEREWFTKARESHHRVKIVLYGEWQEGPAQ